MLIIDFFVVVNCKQICQEDKEIAVYLYDEILLINNKNEGKITNTL